MHEVRSLCRMSVVARDICVIALFYATSKSVMTELFRSNVYSAADKIMVFLSSLITATQNVIGLEYVM